MWNNTEILTWKDFTLSRCIAEGHAREFAPGKAYEAKNFAIEMHNRRTRMNKDDYDWFDKQYKQAIQDHVDSTSVLIDKVKNIDNYYKNFSFSIELQIVEHCDLNCYGCCVGAPLVKSHFADVSNIKNVIQRYSELCNGDNPSYIFIMGGEPTLHPQLFDILEIARNEFSNANIIMITNGLNLRNFSNKKLKLFDLMNIGINISLYSVSTYFIDTRIRKHPLFDSKTCIGCSCHWPILIKDCSLLIQPTITVDENGDMFFCGKAYLYKILKRFIQDDTKNLIYGKSGDVINIHSVSRQDVIDFLNKRACPFLSMCSNDFPEYTWSQKETTLDDYFVD